MHLAGIRNQSLCRLTGIVMIFLVFAPVSYYLYHKNAILVDNNYNCSR